MSAEEAVRLEMANPGWAVFWGAHRRGFTAWATWSRDTIVVEAADVAALVGRMRQAEAAHYRVGRPIVRSLS
ncbi:MAG: hypothetical protein ACJ72W_09310 [Actinoallomurus sp.]